MFLDLGLVGNQIMKKFESIDSFFFVMPPFSIVLIQHRSIHHSLLAWRCFSLNSIYFGWEARREAFVGIIPSRRSSVNVDVTLR